MHRQYERARSDAEGLLPDLATIRDRCKPGLRKILYGIFSMGWRGGNRSLAVDAFASNGDYPLNFVSQSKGALHSFPSPAHLCRSGMRVHCVILSRAGIRSGHRIVKWLSASRQ